jgi:hypothetical protein
LLSFSPNEFRKIVENSEKKSNCNKNQFQERVSGAQGPLEVAIVGIAIMT